MKDLSVFFFFSFFLFSFLTETKAAEVKNGIYIVYMGAAASPNSSSRNDHAKLLNSLLRRKQNALVHNYNNGFAGFAARLSEEDARSIAKKPGVVSVFADPILKLHTTRSWDFLRYQTDLKIDSGSGSSSDSQSNGTADSIIGILDTGIWPESESFNDKGMGPIPKRWNGTCMEGHDFSSSNCNKKLIGARYYFSDEADDADDRTPRDFLGHGTHVASTAAGNSVSGASYYGLATGTAKGGSPGSRLAIYRVCTSEGCRGSNILAAFDHAITDGVDVLSLSLGSNAIFGPDLYEDPIAIGAFHAVEKGITVVCSAGNDGPNQGSVVNVAPWILTVAASTIDRDFESDVVLGNNKVIKGESINFADIKKSPEYPLIYGSSTKSSSGTEYDARQCNIDSMDGKKIKGKIVVCEHEDKEYSPRQKLEGVKNFGGIGLILIDDESRAVASSYGTNPMTVISSKDAAEVLSYINSTRNPVATILAAVTVTEYKPAPAVAFFSSRGPSRPARNILKPDIAGPGVDILAAWIGNDTSEVPAGKDPSLFNVISGTSMSCPHVSGIAATVKAQNPNWSPSAIRSAIMTTAFQTNNLKDPITTDSGSIATPYDFGAGEVSPSGSLQPGLVYETGTIDYLTFLCHYGYNTSKIKAIVQVIPDNFTCPKNSNPTYISDMNYPSISIFEFKGKESRTVSRSVTNVGVNDETAYIVTVNAPKELNVTVMPDKLQFTKKNEKLTYQVGFSSTTGSLKEDVFGSITWSNGKYKVRSPFVVSSASSSDK